MRRILVLAAVAGSVADTQTAHAETTSVEGRRGR